MYLLAERPGDEPSRQERDFRAWLAKGLPDIRSNACLAADLDDSIDQKLKPTSTPMRLRAFG